MHYRFVINWAMLLYHHRAFALYKFYKQSKGKAVPLQAWSKWPTTFKEVKVPDFMVTAQDGGKIVSLTHRPPLPPGNTPGTHFC
jgi:hypothetical protein